MSLIFISEYNQTYLTHTSCYYCLGPTLCYIIQVLPEENRNHQYLQVKIIKILTASQIFFVSSIHRLLLYSK